MKAAKLASDAVEILAADLVNAHRPRPDGGDPAAGARTSELGRLVRWWFEASDRAGAFEAFTADPANDVLVRALLQQAVERDAAFARSLSAAVEQARAPASPPVQNNSVHVDASGARGGTFTAAGRDSYHTENRTSEGGGLGVPAAAVLFLALLILAAVLVLQR